MFSYDWISATHKVSENDTVDQYLRPLGLNFSNFIPCRPAFGYLMGYKFEGICLYAGGSFVADTILLSIPGKACTFIDSIFEGGCDSFVDSLKSHGWKFTRYDRCVDVPYAYFEQIKLDLESLNTAGRFKSWQLIRSYTSNGDVTSSTLYIGSYKSDYFIRIYDKGAQLGLEPLVTARIEIVSRNTPILSDDDFNQRLLTFFRPTVGSDTNKSRRLTSPYFEYILNLPKISHRSRRSRNQRTPESCSEYFKRISGYVKRQLLSGGASYLSRLPTSSMSFNRLYYNRDYIVPSRQFGYCTT